MFIELLDALRCTNEHPPINLVAVITKREGRHVLEGTLGCPTCRREYAVSGGAVWFHRASKREQLRDSPRERADDGALRVGAALSASDGATIAVIGPSAQYAAELAEMVALRAYAVNPAGQVPESERVGVIHTDRRLPFGDQSLSGIYIDEEGWTDAEMERAVRSLRHGGRILAPSSTPLPQGVDEVFSDAEAWIGEKQPPLVGLRRG